MHKAENAIIMAAGFSSRFAPLSYEYPKALVKVKGEILIERQIRQLKESGIDDITIVVGYKKEMFNYLIDKFDVSIVENPEYSVKNNHSSLYYVRDKLANTYICSSDNYFADNVFDLYLNQAFYSSVFSEGKTNEWCLETDEDGLIIAAKIGCENAWIMLGHVFFTREFSNKFVQILEDIYDRPETASMFWESIYIDNIEDLEMYIRKYPRGTIFEFDSLDELRAFDESYWNNSGSEILKEVSQELSCSESDMRKIEPIKKDGEVVGFEFWLDGQVYNYDYNSKQIRNLIERSRK